MEIILGRKGMGNSGILIQSKLIVAKSKEVYDSSGIEPIRQKNNDKKTKIVKQPVAKTEIFLFLRVPNMVIGVR